MADDLDARVTAALRTLEREPAPDGRAAVARRVARRRLRRSGAAIVAVAAVTTIAVGIVARDSSPHRITIGNKTGTTVGASPGAHTPPPLSDADAGILAFPSTIAQGQDLAAVLRNPTSSANVACFVAVRLDRWNGDRWIRARDLVANGADPNAQGPDEHCPPDLLLPGAFIGEQIFTIPGDVEPGDYRLVDQSTEGEGRITVVPAGTEASAESRPVGHDTIDLSQGTRLTDVRETAVVRALVLDDNRLAIAWNTGCNGPAQRLELDYEPDRVTARLFAGYFLVTDCVGEPSQWSTVVDLPRPLWGRHVIFQSGSRTLTAERVDATPLSTFVLPGTAAGTAGRTVVATSVGFQRLTPVSIQVDVFGGACLADAQSVVLRAGDGEIFVQPHVQVVASASEPGDTCSQGLPGWRRIEPHVKVPAGSTLFGPSG